MLAQGLILSTRGHAWVMELPKLSLPGRSKLTVLCFVVALLLNVSALVNLRLRGKAFLRASWSPSLAPLRHLPELVDKADTHKVGVELFWARLKVMYVVMTESMS